MNFNPVNPVYPVRKSWNFFLTFGQQRLNVNDQLKKTILQQGGKQRQPCIA